MIDSFDLPSYDRMPPDQIIDKKVNCAYNISVCCVCGDGHKTLLKRNGKMICRDCYAAYLRDVQMKGADK